ncbi:hypothetical protein GCM10010252_28070 [Streptomyces aureoverticillatus]|nr:hypothetical protein GCM10010252_28070 [Streptomyces aureoverticillatus]
MAPESFSARPANTGTGELLDPTSLHWGTAELGTPSHGPAAQAAGDGTAPWTEPGGDDGAEPDGGDAIAELIHAAAVSRPLDDVVHLVTLLEQSPEGLTMAASVLRTAAVVRSVDDVTRLVEELGPPDHPVDHMDDAIRRAAEERPISEVSRLVLLLHRPPYDPHTSAQAVQAAATARSVEDLVQLISRLGEDQAAEAAATNRPEEATTPLAESTDATPPPPPSAPSTLLFPPDESRSSRAVPLVWMRRLAGVVLVLCGAAHFPTGGSDAPSLGLAAAFGVAAVCAAVGIALCLTESPAAAVLSTFVTGALTIGHLVEDRVDSKSLLYVLRPEGVAPPLPALSAALAALASLLVVAATVARLRAAANRHSGARR